MHYKKKNKNLLFLSKEFVIIILLFIVLSGILGVTGYYIGFLMLPIILLKYRIIVDKELVWLIIFSFSYALITTIQGLNKGAIGNIIFFSIYPPLFYILGKYISSKWPSKILFFLFLLAFSFSLKTLIAVFLDINRNGFLNLGRIITDVGFYEDITATLHGANVSLFIASLSLIFALTNRALERIYRNIFILFGILALISILHLNNRTGLVILLFSLFVTLSFNLRNYTISKYLIFFTILGAIIYYISPLIFQTDLIDVYSNKIFDPEKGISTVGARDERWISGIRSLFNSPFGGGVFKDGERYYAHNFWLDIAEMGGIIPFMAIVIFSYSNIRKNIYIVCRYKYFSTFFISLILVYNVGFLLTCMVEPMMEGRFVYVFGMFFFWGITNVLYSKIYHR